MLGQIIRMERPNRRRNQRSHRPLEVLIDGVEVAAVDWSLGGVRLDASLLGLKPGDSLTVEISAAGRSGMATGEILESEGRGTVLRFTSLTDAAFETLEGALMRRGEQREP
jgi:hypothetical protein